MESEAGSSRGNSEKAPMTTVVLDYGRRRNSCGYCQSHSSSISHGLWANTMTVDHYQELLDRGWRRSGSFLYKPEMESTCCPQYTIRLNVHHFSPSKEQARVLKKFQRFLDGKYHSEDDNNSSKNSTHPTSRSYLEEQVSQPLPKQDKDVLNQENQSMHFLSCIIDDAVFTSIHNGEFPSIDHLPKANVKKGNPQAKRKLVDMSEDLVYTCSISFQLAAALKRSLTLPTITENQAGDISPIIIAGKLASHIDKRGVISDLRVKACNGHLNFYSSVKTSFGKEPVTVDRLKHCTKDNKLDAKDHCREDGIPSVTCKRRRLEILTKRSCFDPEEYALYRKYQIKVHNDKEEKVTEESYTRFLVDTPLIFCSPSDREAPSCGFGSFHQQYLIDGKIVAVGVVDILPKCLSCKYLFWDPDYAFLSLGKFAALREIDWVKEKHDQCHSLQYYYLGYYIHSCTKMRYKAAYCPSELLCPLRYRWVPFHLVRPYLDEKAYVILSDVASLQREMTSTQLLHINSSHKQGGSPEKVLRNGSHSDGNNDVELDVEEDSNFDAGSNLPLPDELSPVDIKNIMINFNGISVRFKDLQKVIGPIKRKNLEALELQLHRYVKVVGSGLADQIIYSLG